MLRFFKYSIRCTICVLLLCLTTKLSAQDWNPMYSIGTINNQYNFNPQQNPTNIVEIFPPILGGATVGLTYQWEKSNLPLDGFVAISGATNSTLNFTTPLSNTTYFRRKVTHTSGQFVYSNVVKLELVSRDWEDINYTRVHSINKPGVTDWISVDNLAISADEKFQTTYYKDGLGRSVQTISKGTATPQNGSNTWGDLVSFNEYDQFGRQSKNYLPFSSSSNLGRFKSGVVLSQEAYYASKFNETNAFTEVTQYDNSPLNKQEIAKLAGASWATANGHRKTYELNTVADEVKILIAANANSQTTVPIYHGNYQANTLYKYISIDENGKQVIEFVNKSGQLVLKKVQVDDYPSSHHNGWQCTYYVYNYFGRLKCTLEPEATKYCSNLNNWHFVSLNDPILEGYCFFYNYDEKGRIISKKSPGSKELLMIYDQRDRLVFTQDGNQRLKFTAPLQEWTAILYDDLDRPIISTLYKTTKTRAALQSDIDNAVQTSTVNVVNAGQPIVDLVLTNHTIGTTKYAANNSVEVLSTTSTSFESDAAANFTIEIDPNVVEPQTTVTTTIYKNPITAADLNNTNVCTILKYNFYDNYNFNGVLAYSTGFNNHLAYNSNGATIQNIAKTNRVTGFATGSKTRVLNTDLFITSTSYFNEDGQLIQNLETNIKNGLDITTVQYHFNGAVLSTSNIHKTYGTGYANFETITKNIVDKIGRTISIAKKFGNNGFININEINYDDLGRAKTKILLPNYANQTTNKNGLEQLNYSYNLHGVLTGINKDYALKASGFNKWSNYFGLYLGYDNKDGVFNQANLNGQITGSLWTTQGDDAQRKYDYTYDNVGRLAKANFTQKEKPVDSWLNSKLDFSVTGAGGNDIEYDYNGNLLKMQQMGAIMGQASPVVLDNLEYEYQQYSNKLVKVTDVGNAGSTNGILGDFKDGVNTSSDDYIYDSNGNLIVDLNKAIGGTTSLPANGGGIKYNFLDKPEEINITNKGVIKYVYDASGNKLQKIYTPTGSTNATITTYINQFTYEETKVIASTVKADIGGAGALQSISFEEGRIRLIDAVNLNNGLEQIIVSGSLVLENNKSGVFDFYVKDHLSNVRMVLTSLVHSSQGTCTFETTRDAVEQPVFGNTANGRVATTSIPGQPWTNAVHGNSITRLSKSTVMVGASSVQKVMAGDKLNVYTEYYYQNAVGDGSNNLLSNILTNLAGAITGSNGVNNSSKNAVATIVGNLNNTNTGFIPAATNSSNTTSNKPRAFLNVLFFDERFNFIAENSQSFQVGNGTNNGSIVEGGIQAPKNGFVYVFLSNESTEPVYFDNLKINHIRGQIVEESHYYAFGLKIGSISSKKMASTFEGSLNVKEGYQGEYSDFEEELNYNDFPLRTYDPQIGRWLQQDLYDEFSSPYVGMGNDPINNIDPTGGWILGSLFGGVNPALQAVQCAGTVLQGSGLINLIASVAVNLGNLFVSEAVGNLNESIVNQVIPMPSEMDKKIVKAAQELVSETPDSKHAYQSRDEQNRDKKKGDDDPLTGNSKKARSKMNCTEFVERVFEKAGITKDKRGKPFVDDTKSLDGLLKKLRNDPNWVETSEPRAGAIWILEDNVLDKNGKITSDRADHAGVVIKTYKQDGHLKYQMAHAKGKDDGIIFGGKEYDWPSERKNYSGRLKFFVYKSEVIF